MSMQPLKAPRLKRFLPLGIAALLSAALLTSCGNNANNSPAAGNSTEKAGSETVPSDNAAKAEKISYRLGDIINQEQVNNFNPYLKTGNYRPLFDYVYDSLFYFNPVKGELINRLATDGGTWSADGKTFTVKLNTAAKWHDGQPFTADDVVYTFQALKDHPVLDSYQLWSDTRLSKVTASGADTVVFELNGTFPSLPNYLSTVYIVPKHVFEKENPETFLNKTPIGTGAFAFKSINESAVLLAANADYFLGAPKISELVLQRFKDSPAITLSLQKGEIQGTTGTIAMPSLPKLLENKDNKLQQFPGLSTFAVIINNDKPGLKDPAVRKAIQQAINRQEIVDKGEMGAATLGNPGFLSQGFGSLVDADLQKSPSAQFSIEQANKTLSDAGYKKNGKGIYEKDGVKLSFVYYMAANAPAQNKEGTMITDWLKQAGIETSIKLVTWPELTSLATAGNYDLVQNGITVPPDPQAALEVFHSKMTAPIGKNAPGLNWERFKDAQVDQWLDQASAAGADQRAELYKKVQDRIAELAPIVTLYSTGKTPYSETAFTGYDTSVPATSVISLAKVTKK
ncbi:ABC transporter substrate-binding protein [Paenibacillus rhizovicinus]|uniref:ABC transporter substrate-binding protein n=1 Tax=Paenibacillus rhizovicinus TaxID=2704463 RepID=A0A6C0P6X6_9BACL|nr:ABC transporter substrate-binding protein [Paenibacillus rhizovicinus]QHW33463.1 ABC transporter substrate-binding protein [Paenibacillus rhizovicinus]